MKHKFWPTKNQDDDKPSSENEPRWIRGINLGGWLVLERYIVPYQFALTDCHVHAEKDSDLCWYEGALSAPSSFQRCDMDKCQPYLRENIFNNTDFPIDEWHLAEAFENRDVATTWFNTHFDHFITRQDFVEIKKAGFTHVRVPLPHWVLGDVQDDEPWIVGKRWEGMQRAVEWARKEGLQVWPNLHTAPGSQNGFDNSGIESVEYTADGWWKYPERVNRTVRIVDQITARLAEENMLDVVTGFGLLNEPFGDCDMEVYKQFLNDTLAIARRNLGQDAKIFVADRFASPKFNNDTWWLDEPNTYLDSHIYHVFAPSVRMYNPKQHIERVCHPDEPENTISDCCYEDPPNNTRPSRGVRRISTEWSAAFDAMPGELLQVVMKGIAVNGTAPDFYRQLSPERGAFVQRFAEAQMVALEDPRVSDGWFFWTWKTEGGAYAEWDYSQGLREGWLPHVVDPNTASAEIFGSCDDIMADTDNDTSVIHPYPWIDVPYWTTDDAVEHQEELDSEWNPIETTPKYILFLGTMALVIVVYFFMKCCGWCRANHGTSKAGYTTIGDAEEPTTLKV